MTRSVISARPEHIAVERITSSAPTTDGYLQRPSFTVIEDTETMTVYREGEQIIGWRVVSDSASMMFYWQFV